MTRKMKPTLPANAYTGLLRRFLTVLVSLEVSYFCHWCMHSLGMP